MFELWTSEDLFRRLQENLAVVSGAVKAMIGDEPIPDVREVAASVRGLSFEDFFRMMQDNRAEIASNMDLQEMIATITQENVDIQRELLMRVNTI